MARILVVEDEQLNIEIISRMLKLKGHVATIATNAADAVALAMSEMPELILMDMTIPQASGETPDISGGLMATRSIRAEATTSAIPILGVTARSMPTELEAFREAGCFDVATKPYDFAKLLSQIDESLK